MKKILLTLLVCTSLNANAQYKKQNKTELKAALNYHLLLISLLSELQDHIRKTFVFTAVAQSDKKKL